MAIVETDLTTAETQFYAIFDNLMQYWKNIAINIFEWKGLEELSEDLTSEILEATLFDKGKCLFFKDEMLGYLALPVSPYDNFNVYGKPLKFTANGINYIKQYDLTNSVLIRNNQTETATKQALEFYIWKLADIEMTKSLNLNAHKMPITIECNEDSLLTAKNIIKKRMAWEPVIFKRKTRGEGDLTIEVKNSAPAYILDKLEDDYNAYIAKILTYLGLDNYCEDKKERVQSAEVESQQEYIISSFRVMLEARQKACDKINKMFGVNLSIDYVKNEQIEPEDENVPRETNEEEAIENE